jgi:hypothetical protein
MLDLAGPELGGLPSSRRTSTIVVCRIAASSFSVMLALAVRAAAR